MMSVLGRAATVGDSAYGDQEKNANALLMELDKGLRSGKAGEQSEAIVRFPRLFEKYPFPILINSSFLKLADVFRVGNNFLRICVLQVTQQSAKHLEKITSIDEFVRRIYSVIRSNDPVARALTLRTLGRVACIIPEKKIVHHSIISSLDSRDQVELEAAIFAASLFAAKSKSFAASICDKLLEMIEYLSVPVDIKLKIMSVFERMNCNVETSQQIRRSCSKLLDSYSAVKFVQTTLHTLTLLSVRSLADIPQQLDLLLQHLTHDSRKAVKLVALNDLRLLALRAPHVWSHSHILSLCDLMKAEHSDDIDLGILKILAMLSSSVAIIYMCRDLNSQVLELCQRFCYHENHSVMERACSIFINVIIQKERDGDLSEMDELYCNCCSILDMALSVFIDNSTSDQHKNILRACLKSLIRLCTVFSEAARHFTDVVSSSLSTVSDDVALSVCEFLSAVGCIDCSLLLALVPDILNRLHRLTQEDCQAKQDLLLSLVRLVFQAHAEDGLNVETTRVVTDLQQHMNGWTAYRMSRQAARYAHHSLASDLFGSLSKMTGKEHTQFWLIGLRDCCSAEGLIQGLRNVKRSTFTGSMQRAEASYHTGIVSLKAAATPTHLMNFQIEYFSLRVQMIQALLLVVRACGGFQMSPPPAIATSMAIASGDDRHRCGHVLNQLEKSCERLKAVESKYQVFYQSSFDADSESLANIDLLIKMCHLMIYVIETIIHPPKRIECIGGMNVMTAVGSSHRDSAVDGNTTVNSRWDNLRPEILDLLHRTIQMPSDAIMTFQDIECVERTAVLLSSWRHCLPRYIFQRLQMTDIKLAISPSPRLAGEPILIQCEADLTLKVEGVIQTSAIKKRFRNIDNVQLIVKSSLECRANTAQQSDKELMDSRRSNDMTSVVSPHNDYFSSQFLLSFPVAGQHVISVEASVVNKDGLVWLTGPQSSVIVKSFEDAIKQYQQQQQQQHHVKFANQA